MILAVRVSSATLPTGPFTIAAQFALTAKITGCFDSFSFGFGCILVHKIDGGKVNSMAFFDMQCAHVGALERLLTPRARKRSLVGVLRKGCLVTAHSVEKLLHLRILLCLSRCSDLTNVLLQTSHWRIFAETGFNFSRLEVMACCGTDLAFMMLESGLVNFTP